MLTLKQSLKSRCDYYKAHGGLNRQTVRNYLTDSAYASESPNQGSNGERPVWYLFDHILKPNRRDYRACDFSGQFGLRCVAYGHDAEDDQGGTSYHNREASGYYADSFQDRVIYPLVYKLSKGRGYVIGYFSSDNDEAVLYGDKDAFYAAGDLGLAFRDSHRRAERMAESDREEDERQQVEMTIEDKQNEIATERTACLSLIKQLKQACPALDGYDVIKEALRDRIKSHVASIKQTRREIAKLQAEPWTLFN